MNTAGMIRLVCLQVFIYSVFFIILSLDIGTSLEIIENSLFRCMINNVICIIYCD